MVWQFSRYFPLMLAAAVISIAVAAITLRRRSVPGSGALAAVNVAGAIWALTTALQLASRSFGYAVAFHKLAFIGIDIIGIAMFAFAAQYTGRTRLVTIGPLLTISLLPAVTQVLVWTSEHHTLVWKALTLDATKSPAILRETPGVWWWIDSVYTYCLLAFAVGFLARMFLREPGLYRRQVSALLIAIVVPVAADAIYTYGLPAAEPVNLAPALFTWVGLVLYWGFTRYKLLDVAPAAREFVTAHMSDSVIATDTQDRAMYLNPAAEKLIGRELRAVAGRHVSEVMSDCPSLLAPYSKREDLTAEGSEECEHAGRFYEGRVSALRDRRQRVRGTILVLRDTTDRKLAELALVEARRDLEDRVQAATAELRAANVELFESRTRLAHLLASSPVVIYSREPREPFAVTFVGDNLESRLGYGAEAILGNGHFWREHLHPEDRHLLADIGEVLHKEQASYEYRLLSEEGAYRWIHDRVRLVRDLQGRPAELIGSWLDVTDRRHMEEQLRQSSKMEAVGVLAGGISHDFNNLLTAMGGYAELIWSRLTEDDPTRRDIAEIRRAVDRAASLTRQLLAFSRKQVLRPRVMSLNDVVRATEEMFGRLIGEHIEYRTELAPDLGPVLADPGQMEQICMNLIVNARDAMPLGGRLIVRTENVELSDPDSEGFTDVAPGAYVMLSVSDTGHGIEEDVLPHVFEPFFTTKADRGTGLGLATVYGIAGQSGGRVTVESTVGKGTTFRVLLPRLQGEVKEEGTAAPAPAKRQAGSETVLVVEDDAAVRSLIATALHRHGFGVREADGAEAALELIDRHGPPDLLVTDVVMRALSGPDLVRRLRETFPRLRVLYISGYARDDLDKTLQGADARLLAKPFTMDSLVAAVRGALSES